MPLNIHLLRMFFAVVRSGSFSKAALALNVSQPAISKGVRDFETQIGCRLFNRTSTGATPTNEGFALSRHAETLFAVERVAEQELAALRGLHQGSLRIGASTTIATYMLSRYLGAFQQAHPGVNIHLASANTRDISEQMSNHEIDVGLVEGPIDNRNLVVKPWRTDIMQLIVSQDHVFAKARNAIDPKQLRPEVMILREPGSGSREVVMQTLAHHGVKVARTLEIGSTAAIKEAVAAGLGISIVSTTSVKNDLQLGRLRTIVMDGVNIERTLWQLKLPGQIVMPAARAFERMLFDGRTFPNDALNEGSAESGLWDKASVAIELSNEAEKSRVLMKSQSR